MGIAYNTRINTRIAPHLGKLSLKNLFTYSPTLMLWGGASAAGLLVFIEGWPLFRQTFFQKIPVFGSHWVDDTPEEDKPQ
ncbi:ubiquinol--cytochrome-c reductase subunit 10 KNAG_0A06950 [Huiozyma naganishii CBS 8797]|uniref:Cytochrome b-c1 complex subunit 10 n=1 Tax=Huiozyma naganishii (strain ATCC MYA-139 / BCRC 22969 / CBS 8797 / KCTC 17520 / NBRC 10181 / NCYC 3082 / Yp74L-3) TaxID=1071383 RepID=J7S2T9_HUIN7|nr:hypothetical protein KNAG_0A06950 [Kazachstania naganishii CBS 8797]CCK68349.1 hypothetical protein KNAG_0A06950 [Kazachstania naganishii CBS 8797]